MPRRTAAVLLGTSGTAPVRRTVYFDSFCRRGRLSSFIERINDDDDDEDDDDDDDDDDNILHFTRSIKIYTSNLNFLYMLIIIESFL